MHHWAVLTDCLGYDPRRRPVGDKGEEEERVVACVWRHWEQERRRSSTSGWTTSWVPRLARAGLPTELDHYTGLADVPPLLPPSPTATTGWMVRCKTAVRWTDAPDVARLYEAVGRALAQAACAADRGWGRKRVNALHAFHETLLPRGNLLDALRACDRQRVHDTLVRLSARKPGYVLEAVHVVNMFARGGVLAAAVRPGGWIRPLWCADPLLRRLHTPRRRTRPRGVFTAAELDALAAACGDDPVDDALFVTFTHTGLRSAAVARLRVDAIGAEAMTVLEKNAQRRTIALDPRLRAALARAVACNGGSEYVFPHPRRGPCHPRTPGHNRRWLRRLCRRAGVSGPHCHVHAFRRTVVTQLMEARNTLSDVSAWIGHATLQQTSQYWEKTPAALTDGMTIPWLAVRPVESSTHPRLAYHDHEVEEARWTVRVLEDAVRRLECKQRFIEAELLTQLQAKKT